MHIFLLQNYQLEDIFGLPVQPLILDETMIISGVIAREYGGSLSLIFSRITLGKSHYFFPLGLGFLNFQVKREPSCTVGGNVNCYKYYRKQYAGSLKN